MVTGWILFKLSGVEKNLSPATIRSYQEDLRHLVFWLEDRKILLGNLTLEELDLFLNEVVAILEYSPTSVARHFPVCEAFLNNCCRKK
jgi:integrase/recombinase XerD